MRSPSTSARFVAFRVNLLALVQGFQPIAHQLRLAQVLDHLLVDYQLPSRSLHDHRLPIDYHERLFYARGDGAVCRHRGVKPETRSCVFSETQSAKGFSETQRH